MDIFLLSGWLVPGIIIIIALIALAEVIEGWNNECRVFASLVFVNKYEQRICRILWSIVCPLLFILASSIYLYEKGFHDNIIYVIILGFILFIWRYVLEVVLYILLGIFFYLRRRYNAFNFQNTWKKFKNWLW